MAFEILQILVDDLDTPLEDLLKEYERELSRKIVSGICEAVDEGKTYVEIAKIITPTHNITLKSEEQYFIKALEINMKTLVLYEDYELCALAVNGIKKIEDKYSQKYLEN